MWEICAALSIASTCLQNPSNVSLLSFLKDFHVLGFFHIGARKASFALVQNLMISR